MANSSSNAETAKLAIDIITDLSNQPEFFSQNWRAFNAFYNNYAGTQRKRLTKCICDSISDDDAKHVLQDLNLEIDFYASLPPGNMEYSSGDARFRRITSEDMAKALDQSVPPRERLAHLMCAVYQVRCNLFHGSKNPRVIRSRKLIAYGAKIVAAVVYELLKNVEELDRVELDRQFRHANERWLHP